MALVPALVCMLAAPLSPAPEAAAAASPKALLVMAFAPGESFRRNLEAVIEYMNGLQ